MLLVSRSWVARRGKGALAIFALALGLGVLTPDPANAGGHDNPNPLSQIQKIIGPISRGVTVYEQHDRTVQQQARLGEQIRQIEVQKNLLRAQISANPQTGNIENSVANSTQERQLEKSYNAKKANLNVEKVAAKERFITRSNSSALDIARHDAVMADLAEKEAKIDGAYENARARGEGQRSVSSSVAGSTRENVQIKIDQLTRRQDQLAQQMNVLEIKNTVQGATDIGTIFRR